LISRTNGFLLICVIVLSLLLSYPLESRNPLVVDSGQDLLLDSSEDRADLEKNLFCIARCESGHLALHVTKQEEVSGCIIWRISQMGSPVDFGSGDLLSRPFGIMTWCIIEMQTDDLKRVSALAIADVLLDIRNHRCTKGPCLIRHAGK
jgi:hypothetical protein